MSPDTKIYIARINARVAGLSPSVKAEEHIRILADAGFRWGPAILERDGTVRPYPRPTAASPWDALLPRGVNVDTESARFPRATALILSLDREGVEFRFGYGFGVTPIKEIGGLEGVREPVAGLTNPADLLAGLQSWLAGTPDFKGKVAALSERVDRTTRDLRHEGTAVRDALKVHMERSEEAYLLGHALPEEPSELRDGLAKDAQLREAARQALPKLQADLRRAKEELDAHLAMSGPALDFVELMITSSIAQFNAAAEALRAPLTSLLAADHVRTALIGSKFKVSATNRLGTISGERLVTKFLANIPARLRPPGLELDAVEDAAKALAASTLSQIKNGD